MISCPWGHWTTRRPSLSGGSSLVLCVKSQRVMNVDWSLKDNGNASSQCTFFKKWLAQCTTIGMDRILTLPRDTPISLPPYSQWEDYILQKWVRRLTQHFWISSSLGLPAIQRNAIDPDLVYATSSCNVELQSKPVTSKLTSAGSHYVVHSLPWQISVAALLARGFTCFQPWTLWKSE